MAERHQEVSVAYFPSYEIVNDELRDYRFYKPDMLHPSDQAVDYIFERLAATYFSEATHAFIKAWEPIREALNHRPFNPDSEAYKAFGQNHEEIRCVEKAISRAVVIPLRKIATQNFLLIILLQVMDNK